jgi:predicted AAA+ superfamily ATPase
MGLFNWIPGMSSNATKKNNASAMNKKVNGVVNQGFQQLIMDKTPIILTGPPGCGKSYWIQKYAEQLENSYLYVLVEKIEHLGMVVKSYICGQDEQSLLFYG